MISVTNERRQLCSVPKFYNRTSYGWEHTLPISQFREGASLLRNSFVRFSHIYLPAFLYTGLPRGNVHERDSGPIRGAIPTHSHKGWPHHRGIRHLLFSNSDVGSFTSHKNKSVKVLWDGTYGFSSLSKKTGPLQRQRFLHSYLKTLSVVPAGVWIRDLPHGRPAFSQLS